MANALQPTSFIMTIFCIHYILVSPARVVLCSFIQLFAKNTTNSSVCFYSVLVSAIPDLNQICLPILVVSV